MVELAEDEISNFAKVWLLIFVSLSYCYIIGKIIPKGFIRLVAILPVISLFLALPLKITSIHLCGLTSFFISWLANFKLLLFAFGKPPLCSGSQLSFPDFLLVACLPIKIQQETPHKNPPKLEINSDPDQKKFEISENKQYPDREIKNNSCPSAQNPEKPQKISPWNYIIKVTLLALLIKLYDYSNQIPERVLWLCYFFHIYFALEIILACLAKAAKSLQGFELEPQFNEPLLSTSLQDFWGRRWNLMVTSILRPSVYLPTLELSTKYVGREVAKLVAVLATFAVSAIYHELIFYYLGRVKPTFQVTWFFFLHGFCLCFEMAVKKYIGRKMRVPRWCAGAVTVVFVMGTGFWLFLPPLLRAGLVERGLNEYAVLGAFINRVIRD